MFSEVWRLLLKGVTKAIQNETKEQRGGFLSMLLGTPGASLRGNSLSDEEVLGAGNLIKKKAFLMSPYPLTNIWVQRFY